MIRRIKRAKEWEINLLIKEDHFINPPREAQRNALLNKAMNEFSNDLVALDNLSSRFVPGDFKYNQTDLTQADLKDQEIMEDWQIPLMQAMVEVVTEKQGDILEIGFGRGIASEMIQECGVNSHTIIECNDKVVERFNNWRSTKIDKKINLVHGMWQDTISQLDLFDGIFFHTYPLNEAEYMKYVNGAVTFAEHFFPSASAHLRKGGAFTYFSNEIDSLSRGHQRLIFQYFSSFSIHIVPLDIPTNVKDLWWADSMVVVKAVK